MPTKRRVGGEETCCLSRTAAKKPQVEEGTMRSQQQQQQQQEKRKEVAVEEGRTAGWSALPTDLGERIASCLLAGDVTEYIRFRTVCRSWRSAASDPKGNFAGRFRPRKWMMLCDGVSGGNPLDPADLGSRRFFHLSTGNLLWLDLSPVLRSHHVVDVADGLLVLQDAATSTVRVLNPFTSSLTELPPVATQLPKLPDGHITATSANVLCDDDNRPTVMLYFHAFATLAFAKPGDRQWVFINQRIYLTSTLLFQGRLYGMTHLETIIIIACDAKSHSLPKVTTLLALEQSRNFTVSYLVEVAGEMLVARRYPCSDVFKTRDFFQVFKVDLDRRATVPMRSIGSHALFVRTNRTLSVSSGDFPSVGADSIYFFVSSERIPAVIYHIEDRGIESHVHFDVEPVNRYTNTLPSNRPFSLADHLLSFCQFAHWSEGFMSADFCPLSRARIIQKHSLLDRLRDQAK